MSNTVNLIIQKTKTVKNVNLDSLAKIKSKKFVMNYGFKFGKLFTVLKEKGKKGIRHFTEYEENNLPIWTPYSISIRGINPTRFQPMTKESWKSELRWNLSLIENGKMACNKEVEGLMRGEYNNL